MGQPLVRGVAAAIAVVFFDFLLKHNAQTAWPEPTAVLPGLRLELGFNAGVAFGALDGLPTWSLVALSTGLVGVFAAAVMRGMFTAPWPAAGLLLGGAVGNLVDRAADGRVTDFIDVLSWPPFNLADVAITVGIAWIAWAGLREQSSSDAT